ncbi:hypothetical protein E3N88_19834 [Mikania micrantha]|uniref:FAS1 domain-containing protein n=1 Tax=Mikania micrantha TaxID=192012 RepID=A0A5N6NS24_9ASTR|nr:hypothetical protein E3N88_19834 [Mikania micrantha]
MAAAYDVKIFTFVLMIMTTMTMTTMVLAINRVDSGKSIDMNMAIDEMERANYFTFVTLLNMVQHNLFQGNVTFLMPSDRSLSRTSIMLENTTVEDLLLRHSIPSALLFDHLLHLPTNTLLPTSNPDLMLKVSNSTTGGLLLGNVRIVAPNVCTRGDSVRCHGIDGVLSIDLHQQIPTGSSIITCSSTAAAAAPLLAPPDHNNYETSAAGGVTPHRYQLNKVSFTCIVITFVYSALHT